jgi:6-phosphofructokinase 2
MIATITLNPCLDRIITVHGLILDEANRWTKLSVSAGGKGIDVSRAIYEMGGKSTAYGFIGGTAGRTVEILLDEQGVPYNFTPIEQETRTNFIITDTRANRQTRIDAPGPRISKREFERFHLKIKRISPKPELITAGGSVPPGLPTNIYYDIIMEARELGVKAILDSDGHWLAEGIKAKPYLIKPNVREAQGLLNTVLTTESDIVEAALALSLRRGKSLPEACRMAVAMGTAAVLTPGNELCNRQDVESLLPRIEVYPVKAKTRN